MESVAELAGADGAAAYWFEEHWPQIVSFVISFAIILLLWMRHHRLFADVERVTGRLLWLTGLWMLTIVWLPLATAMSGQFDSEPLVEGTYIGSMAATSVAQLLGCVYLNAHPELHSIDQDQLRSGMAADVVMIVLFLVALVVAVALPMVGYFSLFLLMATGRLSSLYVKFRARRAGAEAR